MNVTGRVGAAYPRRAFPATKHRGRIVPVACGRCGAAGHALVVKFVVVYRATGCCCDPKEG